MSNKSPQSVGVPSPCRLSGYLCKIENKMLVGSGRRKCWCAVSDEWPYFFWYKSRDDLSPLGKISLSSASFTFDPKLKAVFEIRCSSGQHIFEASSSQARVQWLKALQASRRRHYEDKVNVGKEATAKPTEVPVGRLVKLDSSSMDSASLTEGTVVAAAELPNSGQKEEEAQSLAAELAAADQEGQRGTTFYLNEKGHLNEKSLEMPEPLASYEFWAALKEKAKVFEENPSSHSIDEERLHLLSKLQLKMPNLLLGNKGQSRGCECCRELMLVLTSLKDYSCDLKDELGANRDLAEALRNSLASAKNQIETLKNLSDLSDFDERINFVLERERDLTAVQLKCAEQCREIEKLRDLLSVSEQQRSEAEGNLEAYKSSVRTKEELIMKLVDERESANAVASNRQSVVSAVPNLDEWVDVAVDIADPISAVSNQRMASVDETKVDDLTEMTRLRDLVNGYEGQNHFLNLEILELQKMVQNLEHRERELCRRNFDVEAHYYQVKSKYLMVLNHVKPTGKKVLKPAEIQHLIDEATSVADIQRSQIRKVDEENSDGEPNIALTDSLGFYLSDPKTRNESVCGDLLAMAAQYKKKEDEIASQRSEENSTEYLLWLEKWDSFVVSLADAKPLAISAELKALMRSGVPKTYRMKIWNSIVNYWVRDTKANLGNGYYEALIRKTVSQEESLSDAAIKQIDLDLARTLPENMYFEASDSAKIEQLRRVLYAYRWHNPDVGYCQGLNRIAAVALLNLSESDAFWFLIAFVEHLQPYDYYTPTLFGALADQKVLTELVQEKLPKVAAAIRSFEVDLSLFTLSWFLTAFVDTLPHRVYLRIFDVLLSEGNKVLFRFALALLKLCEGEILACKSAGALHICLTKVGEFVTDFERLGRIGFNEMNPFPMKAIESKRQHHLSLLKVVVVVQLYYPTVHETKFDN